MGWNYFTKLGHKAWSSVKHGVANVYAPIKKVVSTIHKGSNFVDGLLDKAEQYGVPASLIDLVRDNPVYSTITGAIETIDDLVEKDLPRLGRVVEGFVEHNLNRKHAPSPAEAKEAMAQAGQIAREGMRMARGAVDRFGEVKLNTGATPNRNPTSRAVMGAGMARS